MDVFQYGEEWLKKSKRLIVRYDILLAASCAVAVIFIGVCLGYWNSRIIPLNPLSLYASHNPLKFLAGWDGPYYIGIAEHGYTSLLSTSFYPFYPLMVRTFYYIFRSYLISALFISWMSLIGALYFYIRIIRLLGIIDKESTRLLAVLPFIFFPTAIFMFAAYPEGLFAFLALGSIYFALKRQYLYAGSFLLFANMTHITGLFLIVLDALILWEEKIPFSRIAVLVALGICGASAFMLYLLFSYHNALAFLQSQTETHGWFGDSLYKLILSTNILNAFLSAVLIVTAVYYWDRRRSFAIYTLLFLLIPILGRQWGGFSRYVLMAFPVPMMLYEALKQKTQAYVCVMVVSVILWTYTLVQYTTGYIGS